jgi:hypothetical protein
MFLLQVRHGIQEWLLGFWKQLHFQEWNSLLTYRYHRVSRNEPSVQNLCRLLAREWAQDLARGQELSGDGSDSEAD